MDKYKTFAELAAAEARQHFEIAARPGTSGIAVIAPHGGGIEPGTYELAEAIATAEHAFYGFDAKRPTGNGDLHITSTHFDEPTALELVSASVAVVAVHGCEGDDSVVYLGGADTGLGARIRDALIAAGFDVRRHDDPDLQGEFPTNICNRCRSKRGVQLELSRGLRSQMFEGLRRKDRQQRKEPFHRFVRALRQALAAGPT